MTSSLLPAVQPSDPSVAADFEVGYTDEDGAEHRVPLQEVWAVSFESCLPVRRFAARKGQRHLSGLWWSATTGRHVGFESWLERDHVMLLDFDASVAGIASQPFWLRWSDDAGDPVAHAPDYFARRSDGSALVVDCRPAERRRPADVAKFDATARACALLGWQLAVLTEFLRRGRQLQLDWAARISAGEIRRGLVQRASRRSSRVTRNCPRIFVPRWQDDVGDWSQRVYSVSAGGSARPTKADVARLANVSTATVSYVLNNAEGRSISPQTREAVRRAARELGYRPNLAARNLARGGSGVVLYVMPRIALGELPIEVGSRLTTALARRGIMHVLQFETDDDQNVVEAIADLDPIAVTSLFPLTGAAAAAVVAAGVPQIHLGSSQLHAIGTLHLSVGEMRVEHLVSRGHRRLAFAYSGVTKWRPLGDYWLHGVRAAARDRELPDVAVAAITARNAADVVTGWVDSGVTAVCAQSDDTGLVVLHGVREAGLQCPNDLAVMGVDAIPAGEVSAPPLTTIAFDATAIVDVAVKAMMSELGYPESGEEPTTAEVATLILRAST